MSASAVLSALHLKEADLSLLSRLVEPQWRDALDFADRSQLTLLLRRAQSVMPPWVHDRLAVNSKKNASRASMIDDQYRAVAAQLGSIEFLALKGITQCALTGMAPADRPQYDIDLYCPRETVEVARDALLRLGLESMTAMEDFPTDHLPVLIRKTGWQWQGDYFDPQIPVGVELHFQFWNESLDRLPAPGVQQFWERRIRKGPLPVLCLSDAIGYTALHVLRHVLHGNLRPFHAYELALILERHVSDEALWSDWRALHGPELRRLESVAFRLAAEWFGCALPAAALDEMDRLPEATREWFEEFAHSPATRSFSPNKDELWLHLSLLDSRADAWRVARRKLLPDRLPGPVDAVFVPEGALTFRLRVRSRLRYVAYVAGRLRHHAMALPRVALTAAGWRFRPGSLGPQFWTFLASAAVFNFALFIFVLLYNLRLLDLGFREDFLGLLQGASTAGTVAGALPAAWLARRFGLRRSLLATFSAAALLIALRSLVTGRAPLLGLAGVWGLMFSAWAVIFSPVIAGIVGQKRRPAAFSAYFAAMFAVGMAGDWIGGRLPAWTGGKQEALLLSSVLAAAALIPAWRLKAGPQPSGETKVYPRNAFIARYLAAFAVWNLATGAFNPFANAFFARQNTPVERIGTIFSVSQLAQVGAVLLAPMIFRKAGLAAGIASMMAATALGLGSLAGRPAGTLLAVAYIAYMSCQWMSEPGITTILMNNVKERERGGAAALNYLVAFSAQALAALAAGALIARIGYGPVLAGAAVLALLAAAMFKRV